VNNAELEAQGYFLDPDHPANFEQRNRDDKRIDSNAAHRESLLPCSRSAGQPLADKEPFTPRTEIERLFPDRERARGVLEARKAAGL
jgi:hypothetical protein